MATNEELEKMIKVLQEQVCSLQDGFTKYQKLLTQEVETKQIKVSESIHIADQDINYKLDTIEKRLNAHDASITTAQITANDAVTKANNAQITANDAVAKANNAQITANDAVAKANNAQDTANDGVNKANNAQDTATKIKNDVAPLVNSQALQQFASLVKYKVRPGDGYGFLVFPGELNIDAWDVYANGQFYSGYGFVPNHPNKLS